MKQKWVFVKFFIKTSQKILTIKKVSFLTFFLKKFETGITIAFLKNTTFELVKVLKNKIKTALSGGFEFCGLPPEALAQGGSAGMAICELKF